MSVPELERSEAAVRSEMRRRAARDQALQQENDHCVLTFRQWCALNGFSEATGRRVVKAGDGPVITELSARRIGVTVGANKTWRKSRERASA